MNVGAVYERGTMSASANETLKDAAIRMRRHNVSSLAVFEEDDLVGIVTERDLTRAIADGRDPARTAIRAYMTMGAVEVHPQMDVSQAAAMMLLLGARHLPVIEEGGMVGMVSARDLLHALTKAAVRL